MYSNLFIYNSLFPKCTQLKTEFRMFSQLLSSQINSSLLLSPHISRSQLTAGSLLAASWRLRGCCPSSHQIRTQSSQSAVSTCLNSQHKPTHTLMGGAKYVKHGTWSWSRTNTCARAWRLKYTKYRIFNHVYDDPPPQTQFNESRLSNMFIIFQVKLLAQRFSVISAQETAAKAKEEHGEEQKPTQVQGEWSVAFPPSVEKSFSSLIQPEVPK